MCKILRYFAFCGGLNGKRPPPGAFEHIPHVVVLFAGVREGATLLEEVHHWAGFESL